MRHPARLVRVDAAGLPDGAHPGVLFYIYKRQEGIVSARNSAMGMALTEVPALDISCWIKRRFSTPRGVKTGCQYCNN